eukprot:COSAG06_NODE_9191_length_1961_cov_54.911165_2_plen_49_part_01
MDKVHGLVRGPAAAESELDDNIVTEAPGFVWHIMPINAVFGWQHGVRCY